MNRKIILSCFLMLLTITIAVFFKTQSARSLEVNNSEEAQAVREVIQRSQRVDVEAAYTFVTDQLATVYINDSRGGTLNADALARIQEVRQDLSLRADQTGILDYEVAKIEWFKNKFDAYMAEISRKEAAGTLTNDEREVLNYVRTGIFTPIEEPTPDMRVFLLTPPAEDEVIPFPTRAYPEPPAPKHVVPTNTPPPYPVPVYVPVQDGPPDNSFTDPRWFKVPYRGTNPELLTAEDLNYDIPSVEIDGEVAKAIVSKAGVTSELTLVKVNGQWYIAGANLLKFAP